MAAEQTALRAAVTEVAEAHEGVSETLIMMWINGEEISDQMVGLHERGVRTFRDLRDDPDAVRTIQQIGVDLGLDLGEEGVNGDYNEATEEAMRQLQSALVEAGYDLGEFGPNNDGIDGAIGQVSMNIMMNAARSVAPDAVVEDAIAEVTFEDRSVERRTNEFIAIGVDGEGEALTPREGEISAEHIGEYASVLARGMEGVQYDSENQTFTHTLTDETLPVADVVSGNYEDVNRADMQNSLAVFSSAQIDTFAEAQGVTLVEHEGSQHFKDGDDRMMSVQDILSDQRPLEMFEQWKSGAIEGVAVAADPDEIDEDYEETEIPATALDTLLTRVRGLPGVKRVEGRGAGYFVELFDGTEVNLDTVYAAGIAEPSNPTFLSAQIDARAEVFAGTADLNLTYVPTSLDVSTAHFQRAGTQVFTLNEVTNGALDDNAKTGTPKEEGRAGVLQEALAAMVRED